MSAKTTQNKVNSVWKSICLQYKFPQFILKSFISTNTDLCKFYHRIKMHKTGPNIKISPIVSNINGPTQCISWLLSRTLGPTLRNIPAHLKNSLKLIRRIQDGELNKNNNKTRPYSRSLDAVSFYTSVSIQEAISNTINRIQYTTHHLSRQDITDLLDVTLQNMYFAFEDCIFCQTKGLPMGCSTSDILAILVVDKLESIVLSSHLVISPYKSYVDIYFQTTNEEKTDKFHHTVNNLHPRLKFQIKKPTPSPKGLSLSLIDFKDILSESSERSLEFYKKPAKKPLFLHHQTTLPGNSKINFICNE